MTGPTEPLSLEDAAMQGELTFLRTLRAQLAERIDMQPPARDLAALSRQIRDIDKDIRKLEAEAGPAEITGGPVGYHDDGPAGF